MINDKEVRAKTSKGQDARSLSMDMKNSMKDEDEKGVLGGGDIYKPYGVASKKENANRISN